MRVFITGGTGFIGSRLVDRLARDGHEILVLSRSSGPVPALPRRIVHVRGDPTQPGPWQDQVRTCGAAVNLAGASIFHRWTREWKRAILESRVATTRNLVDAIGSPPGTTPVLISASAVGYYGPRGDEELGEDAAPGTDFLSGVTSAWETEAMRAEKGGSRVAVLRFGIVLGKGEGALGSWVPLFKTCLGGPVGNGRQWFSWIHVDDLIEAVVTALVDPALRGPVNACAPNPVRNRDLAKALGKALRRPSFFAVPGFVVRTVLGEFAESLISGQRVVPAKLQARGFAFRHPEIGEAVRAIIDGR